MVCDLGALTTIERERRAALASQLSARVIAIEDHEMGYRLDYSTDTPLSLLAEWIELERRCCPFLAFTIELPAGCPSIVLHLSAEAKASRSF
jgi:hypothetical protein